MQDELNQIIANDFDKEQALKELNAQTVITTEFGREIPKQIGDYAQTKELELLAQGNIEEAKKWEEGGVYRVALHTATGLLATGAVEGALTTGGVATIAPKLNEWQDKLTTKLVEKGFEKDTAESVSKFTLNIAIATAGTTAGLDTSSTAYALNTDVNNRQLHPTEFYAIQIIAEKLDVDEEELKKAILYHIDKGWQDNITEKEAEKMVTYQNLYKQALAELSGRSINDYLDDLDNMQEVDLEPSNVTGRQSSENEPTTVLESETIIVNRDFEADKTNLYLKQEGMAFNATNDDFNNGRIFAAKSFNEIQYNYPSLVKDMSAFEKLQETSDGLSAFGNGLVEGGVSNIKGLADAIMNLPNVDISAVRERAYELSSDTIKYLTDSQYRDSVNQEAVYDLKTDIAYGQILALQGDADKIGQAVGEATGKLATDLAISATTVGVGKVAGQTVKIVGGKSNDGKPNLPDVYGDGDLPNVYDGQRQQGYSDVKEKGTLSGFPARISDKDNAETVRSLTRENESAQILVDNGYDVEQRPNVDGAKDPDYKINGIVYDNYAPKTSNPRSIWTAVKDKVDEGQTKNVVINISDSNVNIGTLKTQFAKFPIDGLENIIVIDKNSNIIFLIKKGD
ncbi:hypothetical protein ACSF86_04020 [Moraxella bovoculi]|uniref:CdiA C-terminal domain-containing protein n=1 Tax=Moraxella bovoculi TaxID=386891 RepID=UPI003F50C3FA